MNRTIRLRGPAALATLLALSACTSAGGPPPPPGPTPIAECQPGRARELIGQSRMDDTQVMRATGAGSARQIAPGDPVTMDFQPGRVTVTTDPSTGRITDARCG